MFVNTLWGSSYRDEIRVIYWLRGGN